MILEDKTYWMICPRCKTLGQRSAHKTEFNGVQGWFIQCSYCDYYQSQINDSKDICFHKGLVFSKHEPLVLTSQLYDPITDLKISECDLEYRHHSSTRITNFRKEKLFVEIIQKDNNGEVLLTTNCPDQDTFCCYLYEPLMKALNDRKGDAEFFSMKIFPLITEMICKFKGFEIGQVLLDRPKITVGTEEAIEDPVERARWISKIGG